MRYSGRSWATSARRLVATAGLLALASGTLLLLTPVPGSAATAAPSAPAAAKSGPETVTGKQLYKETKRSTVTVSQGSNLVNQYVHLSWTGFTPSTATLYSPQTEYSIEVAECQGTAPKDWSNCYAAGQSTSPNATVNGLISNLTFATSGKNGTGQADFDVLAGAESLNLGCDSTHPCSIVIVPGQGGVAGKCTNHSQDSSTALPSATFTAAYGACSWADRIAVPLTFSPATSACPLSSPAFTMEGSPVLSRATQSWLSGLCAGGHGVGVLYNDQLNEPQSVGQTIAGQSDVALTTRPASADNVPASTSKAYAYAPLAITSGAVAYWMDGPNGQPYTDVRFNQRLLVKLVTTSYNFIGIGCKPNVSHQGIPGDKCDKAVNWDPGNLYEDPEFKQLNPHVQPPVSGAEFQIPTIPGDGSDLTWTVTRWIAANPAAAAFIKGSPAPGVGGHEMYINANYKGITYPTDTFLAQDPYQVLSYEFSPVYPNYKVAQNYQALNAPAGDFYLPDVVGNYDANTAEQPGSRSLFAIMGDGDAAAFTFPVMALPNAAGKYVEPSTVTMTAAAQDLSNTGSGTQQVNLANTNPNAYPLTMIVYAMVPTSGVSHTKAAAIASFLNYVAGPGQQAGAASGQLPAGYAPLTASLRAQTLKIATEVKNQSGPKVGGSRGGGSGGGGSGGGGSGTGGGVGGTPTSSSSQSPSASHPLGTKAKKASVTLPKARSTGPVITTVAVAHPLSSSVTRFALPALLILGGLALLAGSSVLVGSDSGARLRRIARYPRGPARAGMAGLRRSLGRKP